MAENLHTYMVQQWTLKIGHPIRFSDGERVIAVLATEPVDYPEPEDNIRVTFLVEIPGV